MRAKRKPTERTKASGFAVKLRAFFERNENAYKPTDGSRPQILGPRNANQMAIQIESLGEPCKGTTVRGWENGESLPESRYLGAIEYLMAAPWGWLDDPGTQLGKIDPRLAKAFKDALDFWMRDRAAERAATAEARALLKRPSR